MDKQSFFKSGLLKKYLLGIASTVECAKIAALLELNPDWKEQFDVIEKKFRYWVKEQNNQLKNKNKNQYN